MEGKLHKNILRVEIKQAAKVPISLPFQGMLFLHQE
jgi:hypothetical protein